jgi:hypothetical protein
MKSLSCSVVVVAGASLIGYATKVSHGDTGNFVMLCGIVLTLAGLSLLYKTLLSDN